MHWGRGGHGLHLRELASLFRGGGGCPLQTVVEHRGQAPQGGRAAHLPQAHVLPGLREGQLRCGHRQAQVAQAAVKQSPERLLQLHKGERHGDAPALNGGTGDVGGIGAGEGRAWGRVLAGLSEGKGAGGWGTMCALTPR